MTKKCKDTALLLVIPNFDFEVVTTADEEGLLIVKCNTSNGSIMLIEFLEKCTDSIIPQLNDSRMQAGNDY